VFGQKPIEKWAASAAHYESESPQNLKGVIAFASTLAFLLQALPCAGFDQMRQPCLQPVQPESTCSSRRATLRKSSN
jgi:hypothetical protein